jgi:organic hydroperoxide reductase OsmC/OhrA
MDVNDTNGFVSAFAGCFNDSVSSIIEEKKKKLNTARYDEQKQKKALKYKEE